MTVKVLYTAVATATGEGRNGHVRSSDGLFEADLAQPPELGGAGGKTNPEQLFAAGYSACFLNALKRMAREAEAPITDPAVTAEVGMGRNPEGTGFQLEVTLVIELGGVDQQTAELLAARAHALCPYSNATRGNIPVTLEVVTA
ncbi:organic hydroperoxide resistance protein [Micropruina sp.]|uniref:organic hydroperoxide resistance protein n=1 Tax=Micropruina sp. TaxID=2737536 RepID=UPI0039E29E23